MATITPSRTDPAARVRPRSQRVATLLAGTIALIYALLFVGVLRIDGPEDAPTGILAAAATVFLVVAALLWWRRSRLLWVGVIALQLLMGSMYVAIAPERVPSFEVWGITIRLLSLALVVVLAKLWRDERRRRTSTGS